MSYTLSIGGEERAFDDEHAPKLAQLIADVAHARVEFLILTNDDTGEYVQCAGHSVAEASTVSEPNARLVAERRERAGDGWRQYRLCRRGGSRERLPPQVEGYEGYEQREVLDAPEVTLIFGDFLAGRSVSDGFELMDTTDEDEDEDAAASAKAEGRSLGFFARMKAKLLGD